MPTKQSTNAQTVDRAQPARVREPLAPVPTLSVANGEEGERRHLMILFFVAYIATLAASLWAFL